MHRNYSVDPAAQIALDTAVSKQSTKQRPTGPLSNTHNPPLLTRSTSPPSAAGSNYQLPTGNISTAAAPSNPQLYTRTTPLTAGSSNPELLPGIPPPSWAWLTSPSSLASSSEESDTYLSRLQELQRQVLLLEKQLHKARAIPSTSPQQDPEKTQLREKIHELESDIGKYQRKLANLGHSVTISSDLYEQPIPGIPARAKQTEDNLFNQEYYNLLEAPNNHWNMSTNMTMNKATSQSQMQTLQEKDIEIAKLKMIVGQMQTNMVVKEMELKQKLSTLSTLCQDAASKLSSGSNPSGLGSPFAELVPSMQKQLSLSGVTNTEQKRLEEELQKVVEMNTRWQKYNDQREAYIKQVQSRLKQLEQQAREPTQGGGVTSGLNEEQAAQIDKMLMEQKQNVGKMEEANIKLQDTIRQLKLDLDLAMTEKANLEKENELLRGEMQVHAPGAPGNHSVGDKETISVLEQQVQILTEDFRSERADRERAQSLIAELQQERKLTKRQLQQYQVEQMEDIQQRRAEALRHYQDEYEQKRQQHRVFRDQGNHYGGLSARGFTQCDTVEDGPAADPGEGMDTVDMGPAVSYPPAPAELLARGGRGALMARGVDVFTPRAGGMVSRGMDSHESFLEADGPSSSPTTHRSLFNDDDKLEEEDMLQCPKCDKEFPVSRHQDLLEHTENCI